VGDHAIAQLSDIHLRPDDTLGGLAHPRRNLIRAVELVAGAERRPDVVLLSGDVTDGGDEASYADLRAIVDHAFARTDAFVVYLPGNHDDRETFRRVLLDQEGDASPINQVLWHDGLRVIALDTTVPGEDGGMLADESVHFLESALDGRAPTVRCSPFTTHQFRRRSARSPASH
jgi:3',5'-cyclic-AMP phosphodiesterase